MSNSISRRVFLKAAGASAAAVGAASLLGGCKQNGGDTIVDVKVGDKVSNWNGLGVQLTSLINIDTAPAQAGYEYIAVLTRPLPSALRIWLRSTQPTLCLR